MTFLKTCAALLRSVNTKSTSKLYLILVSLQSDQVCRNQETSVIFKIMSTNSSLDPAHGHGKHQFNLSESPLKKFF